MSAPTTVHSEQRSLQRGSASSPSPLLVLARSLGRRAGCSRSELLEMARLLSPPLTEEKDRASLRLGERWDGTGPGRLAGTGIPLVVRVVQVAAAWEAAWGAGGCSREAAREVWRAAGLSLDPHLVHLLLCEVVPSGPSRAA